MMMGFPLSGTCSCGPRREASQVWLVIGAAQRALTRNGVANYSPLIFIHRSANVTLFGYLPR